MGNKILSYIFRPMTFPRLKIRIFPVLVAGISIDWFAGYDFVKKQIYYSSGSDKLFIPISLIIIFIFLIIIDIWDRKKNLKERAEKIKLLKNPNVPDNVKTKIAEQLKIY